MKTYGLIGKNIDYSFSRTYFSEKFEREKISAEYRNFDLAEIDDFPKVFKTEENPGGYNVTIPYKQTIIPYLDRLDEDARLIGAVNTIKIEDDFSLTGYNTDYYGFKESLKPFLKQEHTHALILGTGGASKAVAFALQQLGIEYKFVSRTADGEKLSYEQLNEKLLQQYLLIINCTPLGTFPKTAQHPALPFQWIAEQHLVYDLIYNPTITALMKKASEKGATTVNGLRMLELQAEKAWAIWNS
ncbi:MAG: shikimate dehydrogenase [Salegentibacter sp.]